MASRWFLALSKADKTLQSYARYVRIYALCVNLLGSCRHYLARPCKVCSPRWFSAPTGEWYLSDLASHLGVRPSSLQRILARLSGAGILLRREDGNRVYYRADMTCPILAELSSILAKTSGIAGPLRDALAPLAGKISLAFIHGSVAEGREEVGERR